MITFPVLQKKCLKSFSKSKINSQLSLNKNIKKCSLFSKAKLMNFENKKLIMKNGEKELNKKSEKNFKMFEILLSTID